MALMEEVDTHSLTGSRLFVRFSLFRRSLTVVLLCPSVVFGSLVSCLFVLHLVSMEGGGRGRESR